METKANYLVIGAFVLAVLAAGFGFVYWMQSFGSGGEKRYQIVFEGGVSGISTASNVLFNGIRVGKVQGMSLDPVVCWSASTAPRRCGRTRGRGSNHRA